MRGNSLTLTQGEDWKTRLIRRWLEAAAARKFRKLLQSTATELAWVRAQLYTALSVNKRISEINERYQAEIENYKAELQAMTVIDPNAQCPACGHCGSTLRTIVDHSTRRVVVMHTCKQDGFTWSEEPVNPAAYKVFQQPPDPEQRSGSVLGL